MSGVGRMPSRPPLEVVVVGSGVAGLEAVIALRALAGARVNIKLVTPATEFVYRPQTVGEPFDLGTAQRHGLDGVAADFDVEVVHGSFDWAAPRPQRIFTKEGDEIGYDALLLAMGARPIPAWDHVVTFAGSQDADAVRAIVREMESGEVGSIAFVVPSGTTWPLPLYELALLTARRAESVGARPELAIYTPEREPLSVFGREASAAVAAELERAGVLVARYASADVTPHGDVVIPFEETPRRFERVISLPALSGPAPRGIPHDENGFIPIDAHGVVQGERHVYAAGDGTDFPIKHGGIAAQQADAAAEVIAKRAGAAVAPRPFRATLRGQLLTGAEPHYLRADLDSRSTELSQASSKPLWWPATKIAGAYLAPYLAGVEPGGGGTPARPDPDSPSGDAPAIVFLPGGGFENNPWGE